MSRNRKSQKSSSGGTAPSNQRGVAFGDGLVNVVAGLGTDRDKAAGAHYVTPCSQPQQLLNAYRSSWLAAAIVDSPAEDATRNWRNWRAKQDQISKIESLEKRLTLKQLVTRALIDSRIFGGAAIYINTGDADQSAPINIKSDIRSLVVITSLVLRPKEIVLDIGSPYFGSAEIYTLSTSAREVDIHASRLVIFKGRDLPSNAEQVGYSNQGWGDSVLEAALPSITQYDSTMANIASLVYEAKINIYKFNGFAELLEDSSNDELLIRRLRTMTTMKGINGDVVIDKEDEFEQRNASFSGLTDVAAKMQENAAGAGGIPVTRLFGRSAAGLSGSGDGDERVYFDRIKQEQENKIGVAMALLDEMLIYNALGSRPEEIYYEWSPLRQTTIGERAEVFSKVATAARSLAGTNAGEIIPLDALSEALVNEFTELGVLAGLDQAIKKYGSLSEQSLPDDIDIDVLGNRSVNDAAPAPLYVSRKVVNAKEIISHYEKQGVKAIIDASKMHVTVTNSKQPVEWLKMGSAWQSEIVVDAGGARVNELFGSDKVALVLSFICDELKWRHEQMIDAGASWDWPEYQPHITISYDFGGDIESIVPWIGEIRLSHEIFEDIVENWSDK